MQVCEVSLGNYHDCGVADFCCGRKETSVTDTFTFIYFFVCFYGLHTFSKSTVFM